MKTITVHGYEEVVSENQKTKMVQQRFTIRVDAIQMYAEKTEGAIIQVGNNLVHTVESYDEISSLIATS